MFKKIYLLLFIFCASIGVFAQTNPKPFVIPELQQWQGGKGKFPISQAAALSVSGDQRDELLRIVRQFQEDVSTLFGFELYLSEGNKKGAIQFELGNCGSENNEAYKIKIASSVKITANEPIGLFWATRTLLQLLEATEGKFLPHGTIVDYPIYPLRGFMLDVGRKYIRMPFLRDYVKFLAYYKMNTFHIHLSDNGFPQYFENDWMKTPAAFRLESETYPGLASAEGHYTKAEFIDLQKLAEHYFIDVIPEIDIPAHTLAFVHYRPELGSKKYGMDHLDLSNPNVYTFFDALFKEYLEGDDPVFRGEYVHIGTDEYNNKDQKVVEQFRAFTDHYIKEVEKYGKKANVWGALTHAKGETPVKVDDVLMDCWYNGFADPREMIRLGYDIVSIPDGLVYMVPAAGYYHDYLNCKYLYEKWTPAMVGNQQFDEGHAQIRGGKFAVWNDHCGNGVSEKDIHHRVWPAMQTLSHKMWKGATQSLSYEQFNSKREQFSEAPGVNINARVKGVKGLILECDSLKSADLTGMKEIGYNYRVEFSLHSSGNLNGAVLFESSNAKFYLRDPQTGTLSLEREGYRNQFTYEIPNDQWVKIAIVGDNHSTTLYVNGEETSRLEKELRYYSQDKKTKMYYLPTLVFPLDRCGNFKGVIKDFKVVQL